LVHVLAIDRHDELAVGVLAELQQSGYRTRCERVSSLTDAAGALERKNWDVVVCNGGGVDFELAEAGAICRRAQPGAVFLAVDRQESPADAISRLAALMTRPATLS
jgi:hypothetical protein